MNYSNRTVARPLSICDARYKPCLLRRQKNYRMVIIRHLDPTRCMRKKKANPPGLRVAGSGLLSLFRRQIFW